MRSTDRLLPASLLLFSVAAVVVPLARILTHDAATWVLGRAAGVAAYVMLTALVALGVLLAHPWLRGLRLVSRVTWIRLHVVAALFTGVVVVLHLVVLALDPWAGLGWLGALVPFTSTYRPVPVGLGVLALWAGVITAVTARVLPRITGRLWWPIHKVAVATYGLVWCHGVFAGSDVSALRPLYLGTGAALLALVASRYVARTATDRAAAVRTRLLSSTSQGTP